MRKKFEIFLSTVAVARTHKTARKSSIRVVVVVEKLEKRKESLSRISLVFFCGTRVCVSGDRRSSHLLQRQNLSFRSVKKSFEKKE